MVNHVLGINANPILRELPGFIRPVYDPTKVDTPLVRAYNILRKHCSPSPTFLMCSDPGVLQCSFNVLDAYQNRYPCPISWRHYINRLIVWKLWDGAIIRQSRCRDK